MRDVAGLMLLASGRDADVYAVNAKRVLRRYRQGGDVSHEASVMTHVAERGYPVPAVHEAYGTDLVMERLEGLTMLQALVAGDVGIEDAGVLLADLHDRLHALPARLSQDPEVRILHLDLHPDNVMLSQRGLVVIDWRNTAEGPPDLDVALSAVILAQVAVDTGHEMAAAAHGLLSAFLRTGRGHPLRQLDQAVAIRRGDPGLTGDEVGRLTSAAELVRRVRTRG